MDAGILGSILTVFFFVLFLVIVWWAYRRDNKKRFDEAAELPFREDSTGTGQRHTD
ncbi:MAG TPA: cbb3-type cytochrome c oxidase subunit 3 [Thiobacillaceae bacterium]|nr:cbb3-type cytochrome c oxidase subunit 3 [Thiobacillaceae bacterium]HNU64021.1 cbb3-type cytochrome c oxidase subunit 3 [Thiobacillaceae bacterium]